MPYSTQLLNLTSLYVFTKAVYNQTSNCFQSDNAQHAFR